jgi:hypothetical protein
MTTGIDLRELQRTVYRESARDGIMEILIGGLLYVCGLVVGDPETMVVFMTLYLFYLVGLPRFLEAAEQRYTYPRIGAVVLRAEKPKPLPTAALFYVLGAAALAAAVIAVSGLLTASEWGEGCLSGSASACSPRGYVSM